MGTFMGKSGCGANHPPDEREAELVEERARIREEARLRSEARQWEALAVYYFIRRYPL